MSLNPKKLLLALALGFNTSASAEENPLFVTPSYTSEYMEAIKSYFTTKACIRDAIIEELGENAEFEEKAKVISATKYNEAGDKLNFWVRYEENPDDDFVIVETITHNFRKNVIWIASNTEIDGASVYSTISYKPVILGFDDALVEHGEALTVDVNNVVEIERDTVAPIQRIDAHLKKCLSVS